VDSTSRSRDGLVRDVVSTILLLLLIFFSRLSAMVHVLINPKKA